MAGKPGGGTNRNRFPRFVRVNNRRYYWPIHYNLLLFITSVQWRIYEGTETKKKKKNTFIKSILSSYNKQHLS